MVDLYSKLNNINLDIVAETGGALSGISNQSKVNTSSIDCIVGKFAYKFDISGYLVPKDWTAWNNAVFNNSNYFSNAYNTLRSYTLNNFVVSSSSQGKGKNTRDIALANALDNSFYTDLQSIIFSSVLSCGGIAFYCTYDAETNQFNPYVLTLDRIKRVYDAESKEYHYVSDDINIGVINQTLELAGLEPVQYISQLPNFRIYFYDTFSNGLPRPRLHSALKLLITLLIFDESIYKASEQNIWLKDLLVKLKERENVSNLFTDKANASDPTGSKKRLSALDAVSEFFENAQALLGFRSKSVLTYYDNDFSIDPSSMLESPATAIAINNILLDRLPSAMGVSAKALGINKGSALNDSGNYEMQIDSQAGEDIARFIGIVITDLYKLHTSFANESLPIDFTIKIMPSSQSVALRQNQELEGKSRKIELKKAELELLSNAINLGYAPSDRDLQVTSIMEDDK